MLGAFHTQRSTLARDSLKQVLFKQDSRLHLFIQIPTYRTIQAAHSKAVEYPPVVMWLKLGCYDCSVKWQKKSGIASERRDGHMARKSLAGSRFLCFEFFLFRRRDVNDETERTCDGTGLHDWQNNQSSGCHWSLTATIRGAVFCVHSCIQV